MSRLFRRPRALSAAALVVVALVSLTMLPASSPAVARPRPGTSAFTCPGSSGGSFFSVGVGGAQKLVSQADLSVCATGGVAVTFAGDPSTGCAAAGVCGYSGTDSWSVHEVGDLSIAVYAGHGRRSTEVMMVIGGPGNPVLSAVQRAGAGGSAGACSDQVDDQTGFFPLPVRGGRVDVGLSDADQPLLGTRCAGPLTADLAAALPHRTVGFTRLERGRLTVDLSGTAPFAAHGFSGTVRSTLRLVLGRAHRARQPQPATALPRPMATRFTTVSYRITHLGGEAVATVGASALSPACGPFDACGLEGTITVAPRSGSGGVASLEAVAPVRRPRRDLLTALGLARGGNPARVSVGGGGIVRTEGAVAAQLTQGGAACTDTVELRETGLVMRVHAGRLVVSLMPQRTQAADPLRTRCPGPLLGQRSFTSGSLPLSVLHRPGFTVSLHGLSFHDGPYAVTTRSTLTVSLRRGRVHTQVFRFVSGAR